MIARASSSEYARTTKSPQRIGEELGVSYILTGTVRWDRGPGVASRVRVSPELVDAQTGVTRWHQSFDTTLTDVFGVQADIAGKVADALNVTVGDAARRQLAAKLTDNSEAYTRYLRGKELRAGDSAPDTVRGAIAEFQQAVTLDQAFAAAWAELALAHLDAFRGGGMQPSDVKERRVPWRRPFACCRTPPRRAARQASTRTLASAIIRRRWPSIGPASPSHQTTAIR